MVNSWLILENQQHRYGDLIGFDPEKRWNYMVLFDFEFNAEFSIFQAVSLHS